MPDGTYDLMLCPYTVKLCREGATPFTITDMVFTGETIECVLSAANTTITAEIPAEWMLNRGRNSIPAPARLVSLTPRTNQSWPRLVAYEWRLLLP